MAADVRSKLGSLGVICRRPEPRDDDEQHAHRVGPGDSPRRHGPARKTPVGSSHTAPRRSDQWPKSGCTSEDAAAEAAKSRQPEGSSGRSARRETGGAPAGRRSRSRSRGARRRGPRCAASTSRRTPQASHPSKEERAEQLLMARRPRGSPTPGFGLGAAKLIASALGGQWRAISAREDPSGRRQARSGSARGSGDPGACAQRLAQENEIGDPADQVLDGGLESARR